MKPKVIQLVDNPREVEELLLFATSSREVEEPLFFKTPSPGPSEESRETASSTWSQFGALTTENEVGTGRILDGTRQRRGGGPGMTMADPTALYQLS